jgi:hypothetical protein
VYRASTGAIPVFLGLDSSASRQSQDQNDQCYDQENVDEAAADMKGEESKSPCNYQDYQDGLEHLRHLQSSSRNEPVRSSFTSSRSRTGADVVTLSEARNSQLFIMQLALYYASASC